MAGRSPRHTSDRPRRDGLADIDPRRVMRLVIPSLTLTISGIQLLFSSFVLHFLLWNVEADRI